MSLHPGSDPWHGYSEKLTLRHLERLAVVYVRQSTMQQVLDHQESTRLQYGLVQRAMALGWSEARVLVIDEDLGQSGATAEGRQGFQRLVAEVGLDHVGLVLGVEMSRLARSSKDWHQLLETCALFGTLIADLDGIYDPNQYNDRLLLGLKGTMSEAELHLIKQRMEQGKLQKARRGELRFGLPIGYVRDASGAIALDPDAQVQHVVRLIFRKFDELGTLHALVRYLAQQGVELGVRLREGPAKGTLEWRCPKRTTLQALLRNPIYAGAYAYGRRQVDGRRKQPGRPSSGRVDRTPHTYHVLLKDAVPAYITWEQYEQNVARLVANRAHADTLGAVRRGPSLLSGLVVCGTCGHRLQVRYGGPRTLHSYVCGRAVIDYGGDYCQYIAGEPIDTFVTQWVLKALEPAALTLSLEATARLEKERQALDQLWQQRLERAAYESERAARHYRLIEPEHRLVARQLAKDWDDKLAAQRQLQEDYERFVHTQSRVLSPVERDTIAQLAQNIPALWYAPTTTGADRKEMIRQIIQRVIVQVEGVSERLHITIEWVGGGVTAGITTRPVRRTETLRAYPLLCERIRALAAEGYSTVKITACLAQEGFRSPRQDRALNRQTVVELMRRLGIRQPGRQPRPRLGPHEWRLSELERAVARTNSTLHQWRKRGWLKARWHEPEQCWVAWADEAELERLKARCAQSAGDVTHTMWLDGQAAQRTDASRLSPV
jgi:DNA invertase Pin-like site-specific DNA recombinase